MSDDFNPARYRKRWFCYLDLLGFTALVSESNISEVISLYKETLEDLSIQSAAQKSRGVLQSWFSDTFIIYSKDDSEREFSYIEQVGRRFFQRLIRREIPVRGAITHGQLYSQLKENIFIGPALVDAYDYAEHQDWLAFVLTPSVEKRLRNGPLDLANRIHYRKIDDSGYFKKELKQPIYAFTMNNISINRKNPYLISLEKMKAVAPGNAKAKYERTISFIRRWT